MKKVLLLLLMIFSLTGKTNSQEIKKKEKVHEEYLTIWVYYTIKDSINTRMYIDIGQNKNHSLNGIVSNGEAENIIFNENGILKVYNNEVDVLNHLSDLGWKVKSSELVKLLSRDYIKYLLVKER